MNKFAVIAFTFIFCIILLMAGCSGNTENSSAATEASTNIQETTVEDAADNTSTEQTEDTTITQPEMQETDAEEDEKTDSDESNDYEYMISADEACMIVKSLFYLNDGYQYEAYAESIERVGNASYYRVDVRRSFDGMSEYVTSYYVAVDGSDYFNAE